MTRQDLYVMARRNTFGSLWVLLLLKFILSETQVEQPVIDTSTSRNVTVNWGGTAYLQCRVHNLGDKAVAWIRRRDFHVLTVGNIIYTTDMRFSVLHPENSDDWILQIKHTHGRDMGVYECAVNTDPARTTASVSLTVIEPETVIIEGPNVYVAMGSSINLTCVVSPVDDMSFMFWYHNARMLNYDQSAGAMTVSYDSSESRAVSKLVVANAQTRDSGNYTCVPSVGNAASVNAYVLNGMTSERTL